jgi:hypothetical protein
LELIADNKSKTYGQDNPVLTFSVVGLTNGDTKASALTADPTLATTAVKVHRRTATRSRHRRDLGELHPDPHQRHPHREQAVLELIADNKSKTYGQDNPG